MTTAKQLPTAPTNGPIDEVLRSSAHPHDGTALDGTAPDGIAPDGTALDRPALGSAEVESIADEVATVLAVPRADEADSFVLHAPLELLARLRLFERVLPADRLEGAAHLVHHLRAIAEGWHAFSPPAPREEWSDVEGLDVADVAPGVLVRTAAAAHAPIFLASVLAEGSRGRRWMPMLAPLQRELERHPDWRLGWLDRRPPTGDGRPSDLAEVLAAAPRVGRGESTSIHPTMQRVDPVAAELLAPILPRAGSAIPDDEFAAWRTVILRTAAASMLWDISDHAPYGWSHALTMPLAVLQLSDLVGRAVSIAVAATHLLGFRCGLSEATVRPEQIAASATPLSQSEFTLGAGELAALAGRRHDAHLVKYSLAVIEAAEHDPGAEALYLDAGRRLRTWWDDRGRDPLDT